MKQKRLDAPVFEFWYLVGDDLRQHLREFHAEGFIHKGVEADLEEALDHLEEEEEEEEETQTHERRHNVNLFLFILQDNL